MYSLKRTDFFEKNLRKFSKDQVLMEFLFKKIKNIQKNPEKGKQLRKPLDKYKS